MASISSPQKRKRYPPVRSHHVAVLRHSALPSGKGKAATLHVERELPKFHAAEEPSRFRSGQRRVTAADPARQLGGSAKKV